MAMSSASRPKHRFFSLLLLACAILLDAPPAASTGASSPFGRARWDDNVLTSSSSSSTSPSRDAFPSPLGRRGSSAPSNGKSRAPPLAFQNRNRSVGSSIAKRAIIRREQRRIIRGGCARVLSAGIDDDDEDDASASPSSSSFLSTSKASVSFLDNSSNNGGRSPSNLSAIDRLLVNLTSDRTSLLLGSVGVLLLLANRIVSFPEDAAYEASRSRIDLLGVFAAGSVLLNGITKLDVESAVAERVALDGVATASGDGATWTTENGAEGTADYDENFRSTVEWALSSFLRCSPARTAVLLSAESNDDGGGGGRWTPLAASGVLPRDPRLRSSIPESVATTPILDRMSRNDNGGIAAKGGTVGGTDLAGRRGGPKESYLPTLQALPGRAEFTYLPPNAQEALLLPVARPEGGAGGDGRYYAVVLGGDTAKSFAPRDIAWCKEIASWIGDLV